MSLVAAGWDCHVDSICREDNYLVGQMILSNADNTGWNMPLDRWWTGTALMDWLHCTTPDENSRVLAWWQIF